ncbi:hypothetical protein IDH41_10725 [Paenibacillus sp. IB182493]|uniref:Uncharacterized protein n=1 Tax=Paenibacillus arenilitoris TaxID=2772299 RepID=A0A927CJ54_9BACL|nr:hypothetical protein [Paenibacillus arenilitoris]
MAWIDRPAIYNKLTTNALIEPKGSVKVFSYIERYDDHQRIERFVPLHAGFEDGGYRIDGISVIIDLSVHAKAFQ